MPNRNSFVIISPICNEGPYLAETIDSMIKQTVKPLHWIIVDDGSTDNSLEIIKEKTKGIIWIKIIERPKKGYIGLNSAEEVYAFYEGLKNVSDVEFDFLGKFDGDVRLDPDYFSLLLDYFKNNPKLGMCSGSHWMKIKSGYKLQRVLEGFVWGPCKFYRMACFESINGIEYIFGWDGIDVVRARAKGWETKSYLTPRFFHNRMMGSRGGILKGKFRYGGVSYYFGYYPPYFLGRIIYQFFQYPYLLGALAMTAGYIKALICREPLVFDSDEKRELHRMQKKALLDILRSHKSTKKGYYI